MDQQRELHAQALADLRNVETIIDRLKQLGPCPLDGNNALLNIDDWLRSLRYRIPDHLWRS